MIKVFNTFALIVFCIAVGEVAATLLTALVFGTELVNGTNTFETGKVLSNHFVIVQSLCSTMLRFVIVPSLYLYFTRRDELSAVLTNQKMRLTNVLLVILITISVLPFILLLADVNERITFPPFLSQIEQYFREVDKRSTEVIGNLLSVGANNELVLVIFVLAIVPGIAEEFFFRGIVQRDLKRATSNNHLSIFTGALFFSLFHLQPFGLLPKLVMGILLGYIYLWSRNLWYPIIAHILNNVMGIAGFVFFQPTVQKLEWNAKSLGIVFITLSLTIATIILFKIKASRKLSTLLSS